MTKRNHGLTPLMTWAEFKVKFFEQYFPQSFQHQMTTKFYQLTQEELTISQYEAYFTELSPYVPAVVADEEFKVTKFYLFRLDAEAIRQGEGSGFRMLKSITGSILGMIGPQRPQPLFQLRGFRFQVLASLAEGNETILYDWRSNAQRPFYPHRFCSIALEEMSSRIDESNGCLEVNPEMKIRYGLFANPAGYRNSAVSNSNYGFSFMVVQIMEIQQRLIGFLKEFVLDLRICFHGCAKYGDSTTSDRIFDGTLYWIVTKREFS
ncbi:hypothetical protein GIB67_014848 [Kingdonia uniflora]|uniref:Retrotransposon gag domain-containing protein n=1 Tax=Kingdonia uniflora TaxID=39325 RepID=A0A7J7MT89_9MAGN|nr:hypothetical protein GIB67_014848 [Kingdonia uniflora]